VKVKEAAKWKQAVQLICRPGHKPQLPLARAKLTLTRHSSMEPDFDGLVSSSKRRMNRMGRLAVSCEVSERWLKFGDSQFVGGTTLVMADVMTRDAVGNPIKLCGLVLDTKEIQRVLSEVGARKV
jgi:hypothetical protein